MVGSIKPLKGNLWVYQEFKKLTKEFIEHHKLKLLFVGEGSDSSRLKETIIQDKMEDFIRVIDKIPNEKIYEVYHLADYYVIGSDFEGTPKSLLEAMYNSLPIIGTDVNGINNIIENRHNGLLVNKTQPGELKNAIQIMVENNDLAKQLGTNANKTYKEKYDFFVTLNRLTEVYHNVSNKYE
jgi:glycosyltransferase involved in cell wall biosynthesis